MDIDMSPNKYYQILNQYQAAQLLFEAIRLDIFSYLDTPVTAQKLAALTGYDTKNVELLLLALASCDYIEQKENTYKNTPHGTEYLSKASMHYLGETVLFREAMSSLGDIGNKVRGKSHIPTGLFYDFPKLARLAIPEMYATGRVKSFKAEIKKIFPDTSAELKVLDLGGGSGILSIEFVKSYPNSKAIIFEHPNVAKVAGEIIDEHKAGKSVSVLSGDFNSDDIGTSYDLIIASGVLDFTTEDLNSFIDKIANALSENGYLLLIGRFSETEGYPQDNMLNWLWGYMNGIAPPPTQKRIETAAENAHLKYVRDIQSGRFSGYLYRREG